MAVIMKEPLRLFKITKGHFAPPCTGFAVEATGSVMMAGDILPATPPSFQACSLPAGGRVSMKARIISVKVSGCSTQTICAASLITS